MQRAFWILVLFNILLLPAMYFLLPERVAIHFDFWGAPNGWASKIETIIFSGVMNLFVILLVTPLGFLMKIVPPEWINIPNKLYWMREENVLSLRKILSFWWWEFGYLIMLIFTFISLDMIRANRLPVPKLGYEMCFFSGFIFIATVISLRRLFLALRIPKS